MVPLAMAPCKVHVLTPIIFASLMELVVGITIINICKSMNDVFISFTLLAFLFLCYGDNFSMQCRWRRWRWYNARYMYRCRSKVQSRWNLWYVSLPLLFVKALLLLLQFSNRTKKCCNINYFSACNIAGAAGDGSAQGTCSDAGQKCMVDGTCGMSYYR